LVIIYLLFLLIQEREAEMTSRDSDVLNTDISSGSFIIPAVKSLIYHQTSLRFTSHNDVNIEKLRKILKRLAGMDLPGKDHVEGYLRHLTRRNRRPRTLYSRWGAIVFFLGMIRDRGKTGLEEITRRDVEAFIEHEQDRGNKITTVRTKLVSVQAFLRYLVEEEIVSPDIFGRRIRLQMPERLPRAMDPGDLLKLLSVIEP
jgi:demethoxyubiquinone hydroxylase (CLK1/Coq7/Cat5 family)